MSLLSHLPHDCCTKPRCSDSWTKWRLIVRHKCRSEIDLGFSPTRDTVAIPPIPPTTDLDVLVATPLLPQLLLHNCLFHSPYEKGDVLQITMVLCVSQEECVATPSRTEAQCSPSAFGSLVPWDTPLGCRPFIKVLFNDWYIDINLYIKRQQMAIDHRQQYCFYGVGVWGLGEGALEDLCWLRENWRIWMIWSI